MNFFLLQRDGRSARSQNNLYRDADGYLLVWLDENKAVARARDSGVVQRPWRVRPASRNDFSAIGREAKMRYRKPIYRIMDGPNKMAKKTTSSGKLVDLFEDYQDRRFAVSSKANSEEEFLTELSQLLSNTETSDWTIRLRHLLPLVADICCKYRGYKTETVQENRELLAGDLDLPNSINN